MILAPNCPACGKKIKVRREGWPKGIVAICTTRRCSNLTARCGVPGNTESQAVKRFLSWVKMEMDDNPVWMKGAT